MTVYFHNHIYTFTSYIVLWNSFSGFILSGKLTGLHFYKAQNSWADYTEIMNKKQRKERTALLYSILERGKKELCVCARVCVYVFMVPFIAKVDLPVLYKVAS